jgi:hypothetical protein
MMMWISPLQITPSGYGNALDGTPTRQRFTVCQGNLAGRCLTKALLLYTSSMFLEVNHGF